jgi:plasmid stability protein
MSNITIRNIPDSVFERLKVLSEIDRRSLSNEILIAIENGLAITERNVYSSVTRLSSETQTAIWRGLAGKWKD